MRPHRRAEPPASGGPRTVPSETPAYPELLLVCEAWSTSLTDGRWRFSIESAGGDPVLEAADEEPGDLNRLTLLAAVRGLEAIDGPASVMLLSTNRYLIRSLADSLPRWRAHDFAWEHFGRVIDIQHADLWRRIDRALRIHRVEACLVSSRLVSPGRLPAAANGTRDSSRTACPDAANPDAAPSRFASEFASDDARDGERLWRVDGPHATPARRVNPNHGRQAHANPAPRASANPADGLRRLLLGQTPPGPGDDPGPADEPISFDADLPDPAREPAHATPGDRRRGQRRHRFTAADLVEAG